MDIKNLSSAGVNLGRMTNTSSALYPVGSTAISGRLKRANVLRATRDYEASLKLGSGAVAKQVQTAAFKKMKEAGGEMDNTGLINQGAIHTGLANQGAVDKGLARQAGGPLRSGGNPFKSTGGLPRLTGGLFK